MASGPEQSSVPASSDSRKNRADPGWKYVRPVEEKHTNDTVCNFCSKLMKGGITRAKEHLVGKSGNVSKCEKVPKEVKEELIKYMKQKKRQCRDEAEVPNAMELDRAAALKGPMDSAVDKRNEARLRQQNSREACDKAVPNPNNKHRKLPHSSGVAQKLMMLLVFPRLLNPIIEPVFHQVVKEEIELGLKKHLTSMKQTSGKEMPAFESRSLWREFEKNISLPVFTGARCDKEVPNPNNKRRKPPHFCSVVREVMKLQSARHMLMPIIEPLFRRVVKEELELGLKKRLPSMKQTSGKEMHSFESRSLQPQFENNISLPVFTGAQIEGEDGSSEKGEKFSSYEDEASLTDGSSHLTDVLYSSNPPNTEGSSANKLLAPLETGGPNYTQASASSPGIMSSIYSVGGTSGLDDFCLPNFDSMGQGYDQSLGFSVQGTNTLICDTDPMAQAFDEDYLQFFLYQSSTSVPHSSI